MSKNLLMVHIPKCAGITMNRIIGLDNPIFFGNKYGHHYASHIKNEKNDYNNYTSFCIIRNPWDRLWSTYNFMKSGSELVSHNKTDSIEQKKSLDDRYINHLKSFEHYICDIYHNKHYLNYGSRKNGVGLYLHKQSNWIMDKDGNQIVDIIGKFEDLPTLVKKLEDDFKIDGLSESLKNTHVNQTKKFNYKNAYNFRDAINMVREMYQDDIKLGEYEF